MIMPFLQKSIVASFVAFSSLAISGCSKSSASPKPAPLKVEVAAVVQKDVPIYGDWVATLDGYVNANVQPYVSGYVIEQRYREGSLVRKGDVLFQIDPRPFQAALDQAKGQLAQAQGQLGQAEAQLQLASINVKRDTPLAAGHAIAQSQLDNDLQAQAQSRAQVKSAEAAVQANQAAVEQARLNLGYTGVRSLIDGIAGLATVQIGNLVTPTTVLTTISQVNPIKVYFPISEQEYLALAGRIRSGRTDLLRRSDDAPLQLTLSNGSKYPQAGHIIFADRQVDAQTGTIRIVAEFPNPGNVLRPGQFGRVRAITSNRKNALLVPQRAVNELQGRYQVATVGQDNTISVKNVDAGDRIGNMWVINSGLQPGDRVVAEGVLKVKNGATVDPQPYNSPEQGK